MILKKFNAVISWLLTLVLLAHIGQTVHFLLTFNTDLLAVIKTYAYFTVFLVSLHVLISLIIIFFVHDGTFISRYAKAGMPTIFQRASGLAIMVLVHAHIKMLNMVASDTMPSAPVFGILLPAVQVLFFLSIYVHLNVSIPRSFITMGIIHEESGEKTVRIITRVLSTIIMLFAAVVVVAAVSGG